MPKTMRLLALLAIALGSTLALTATGAWGQAAESGCPPGQPTGFPPGQSSETPGRATGRPQYPPGRCQLALSRNAAQRGETVHVSGGGYVPGEQVTLSIAGQNVRSVTADPNGAFSTDIVVPANAPLGPTQVLAAGATQRLSAAFEVIGAAAAPATAGSGTLPRTGLETLSLTVGAVALLGVGTVLVVGVRRRRTAVS